MKPEQRIMLPVLVPTPDIGGMGTDLVSLTPARRRLAECQYRVTQPINREMSDDKYPVLVSFQDVFDLFVAKRQVDIEMGVRVGDLNIGALYNFARNLRVTATMACDKQTLAVMDTLLKGKLTPRRISNSNRKLANIHKAFDPVLEKAGNAMFLVQAYGEMPDVVRGWSGLNIDEMIRNVDCVVEVWSADEVVQVDYFQE